MNEVFKHRLVGGAVLLVAAGVLVPWLLGEPKRPSQAQVRQPVAVTQRVSQIPLPAPQPAPKLARPAVVSKPVSIEQPAKPKTSPVQAKPRVTKPKPAPRPVVKPKKPPSPSAVVVGWSVQLASFSKAANAQGLRKKVAARGFRVFVVRSGDGAHHRVYVGPYPSRVRAEGVIPKLKALTGLAGVARRLEGG
jgi:DedD protein